uniref:Protein dpy-30 homolog n=1 Tax=Parastrongyloides trichosuri TaxID=131310 RepID=A0A0N4Z901_PARTI
MSGGDEHIGTIKEETIPQQELIEQPIENSIGEQTAPLNNTTSSYQQQQHFEGIPETDTTEEDEPTEGARVSDETSVPMELTETQKTMSTENVSMQNENVPPPKVPPTATPSEGCELVELPTRLYLDRTVVPILLQGLSALAKERPEQPIEFLANFLLTNKERYNPTLVSKPQE